MRYTMSLSLLCPFLGVVASFPGAGRRRAPGWVSPRQMEEPDFGVLAVPTGPVGAAAVAPGHTQTLYLGGAEGLFRSTDSGETWQLLSRELRYPHILLVDPADPARLYAARRDLGSFLPLPGVYRSDDGGHTWRRCAAGLDEERVFALALDPGRPGTLYAGSWAGRVYRSTDGGERWQPLAAGALRPCPDCTPGTVGQILVSPVDGALYAQVAFAGTLKSSDGGATWAHIHGDGGWLAVDAVRGDLYLAGRRLWHSADGGRTWEDLSTGLPFHTSTGTYATFWVASNPHPPVLYTRYHRSADDGVTWQTLEAPLTFVPRLLLPGARPTLYGSVNGQAARYQDAVP